MKAIQATDATIRRQTNKNELRGQETKMPGRTGKETAPGSNLDSQSNASEEGTEFPDFKNGFGPRLHQYMTSHKDFLLVASSLGSLLLTLIGIVPTGILVSVAISRYRHVVDTDTANQLRNEQLDAKFEARENRLLEQYQAEFDKQEEAEARIIFDNLELTESRYRTVAQENLGTSIVSPLLLRVVVSKRNGSVNAYVKLPQYQQQSGTRYESRTWTNIVDGEPKELEYTVAIPEASAIPAPVSVTAFGCVECESANRLKNYLASKRIQQIELPTDHVRIARAALDFGEYDVAKEELAKAIASTKSGNFPDVFQSKALTEIGQTKILMGDLSDGQRYLNDAKSIWRTDKLIGQLGGLHEILLWESQFAATLYQMERVSGLLFEYSSVVDGYKLGESKTNEMINDAYITCLAIASSFHEYDPSLPAPKEFRVLVPELGGWRPPADVTRYYEKRELPPGIEWEQDVDHRQALPKPKSVLGK